MTRKVVDGVLVDDGELRSGLQSLGIDLRAGALLAFRISDA